jgi:hypothetical protein
MITTISILNYIRCFVFLYIVFAMHLDLDIYNASRKVKTYIYLVFQFYFNSIFQERKNIFLSQQFSSSNQILVKRTGYKRYDNCSLYINHE